MDQIIQMASDVLLGLGAFGAALYCIVLSRRLKRFNNLENGVGGAVAVLSAQVDDMTRTLDQARRAAGHSSETLTALTERAEDASRKLELMLAALNDLPDASSEPVRAPATEAARDEDWAAQSSQDEKPVETAVFATRRSAV